MLKDLLEKGNGDYHLCLAGTHTSDVEGISAAGATAEERRLTPSIDADILLHGRPRENESVPSSPNGIVSPVVIASACLSLLKWQPFVIDCGTFRQPLTPQLVAGEGPAKCLSTGQALSRETAAKLHAAGLRLGREGPLKDFLLIGECIPGGTSTAAALLTAFAVEGANHVSSSVHSPDKRLRQRLIQAGLEKAELTSPKAKQEPLSAVAAVGDPMQAFASGLAMAAAERVPVILAGGSQMLTVYYLAKMMSAATNTQAPLHNIYVVTTKWVAFEKTSDTGLLAQLLGASYFASCPDFSGSSHNGMRAYEEGYVKEGLGIGGLMAAAQAACALDNSTLVRAIDAAYARIVIEKKLVVN